jgi:hypothetical protein
MSDNPCPCATTTFPTVVFNPPAQPHINYRWGDFNGFRAALLQPAASPLPAETQLTQPDGTLIWRPTADSGDLALQIVEWWAYLADILTLYAERAANQAYIGTADLPESLPRLVSLLGYRPRPAIGAQLTLAGLVRGPRAVTLPQGLQVQSKPGPGQQPQVFELNAATIMQPVSPSPTVPQTTPMAALTAGQSSAQVLLAGPPGSLKVGDEVLLLGSAWNGTDGTYALGNVSAITPGAGGTSVAFTISTLGGGTGSQGAANWQLLKAASSSPLYPYLSGSQVAYSQQQVLSIVSVFEEQRARVGGALSSNAITRPGGGLIAGGGLGGLGAGGSVLGEPTGVLASTVHLASIVRSIAAGDVILVENPSGGSTPVPGYVTAVTEVIYNASNPTSPETWPSAASPPANAPPAVPIPHTVVSFNTTVTISGDASTLILRYGYAPVGTLIDAPVIGASQTGTVTLASGAGSASLSPGTPLLVEDANGDGATATLGTSGVVTVDPAAPPLVPPLQVFSNLLAFSRGKTITREVLGNGNPAVAGQDFTLQNAPVTYLADQPGRSGQGYSSTITLWVNDVQWTEVPSFYDQDANAQVFVTREDDQGKTHVLGGDGVNGRPFPSGVGNIVASYRTGGGATSPPPTSVTVLLQPQPGLSALVNPLPTSGGADPDTLSDLRQQAPRSLLTFGRAVSLDDYAAIAAATPGVARVSAGYVFDPTQQRPVVTLWVGDDATAVTAARTAIAAISDPNRPISINPANQVQISLSLTYVRDPRYLDAPVRAALQTALVDPTAGLFGASVVQIGQAFYDSQIYAACLAVPGVQAVHSLIVTVGAPPVNRYIWQLPIFWVGQRLPTTASGGCTGHSYSPGPDGFFVLPNTPATLQLNGTPGT